MSDTVDTGYDRGGTWGQHTKHHGISLVFCLTDTAENTRISLQEKLLTTSCETRTTTDYPNAGYGITYWALPSFPGKAATCCLDGRSPS